MQLRSTCTRKLEKDKCREGKDKLMIWHNTPSVKNSGGRVMEWACMAANETGSLVFTDDVTADRSSMINSDV